MKRVAILLATACSPILQPIQYENPRRNVMPVAAPQEVRAETGREQALREGIEQHNQTVMDKRATAQANAQEARAKALADARGRKLCKAADSDEACLKAKILHDHIDTACSLIEQIAEYKADVAYQWREGKKYGVVDLQEIDSSKSMIEAKEDSLSEEATAIKYARGKKFDAKKDCKP